MVNMAGIGTQLPLHLPDETAQTVRPATPPPEMNDRLFQQSSLNAPTQQEATDKENAIDLRKLKHKLEQFNREFERKNISLKFSIDEDTDSIVIRVVDSATHKLIRQIPPDELLALRRNIQALLGEIFDVEA